MNVDSFVKIDPNRIPRHIAIIMDGNGRWAVQRKQPRVFGHRNGVKAVREVTEGAAELGVEFLTLYAFSTENWNRPKLEVNTLMNLFVHTVQKELDNLNENNIRLLAIGDIEKLPKKTYESLIKGLRSTENNTGLNLVLALNYSARWEILEAVKRTITHQKGSMEDIEFNFENNLQTAQIPDPELMIRTSGEHRISNFLLYQMAYTELYFTDVLWPDFRKKDLYEAIYAFQQRERRFGKTGAQIQS